jgi:hypothetical protein
MRIGERMNMLFAPPAADETSHRLDSRGVGPQFRATRFGIPLRSFRPAQFFGLSAPVNGTLRWLI